MPIDRNRDFDPKIISKNSRDIHDAIQDLYGIEMSAKHISPLNNTVIKYVVL